MGVPRRTPERACLSSPAAQGLDVLTVEIEHIDADAMQVPGRWACRRLCGLQALGWRRFKSICWSGRGGGGW